MSRYGGRIVGGIDRVGYLSRLWRWTESKGGVARPGQGGGDSVKRNVRAVRAGWRFHWLYSGSGSRYVTPLITTEVKRFLLTCTRRE